MNPKFKDDNYSLVRKDGKVQSIIPGMMFVGREECDIILQSASADKRHAVLFFDSKNKDLHIKDLNSLTGTYVNGIRIAEQTYVKLKTVDNVRFGYGPDIFTIQTVPGTPQSSPSHKMPDKSTRQTLAEQSSLFRNEAVIAKDEPIISKGSKRMNDAIESLNCHSDSVRSLELDESKRKSVSPAFSSMTYRKSNIRNIDSSSDHVNSSPSLLKDDNQVSELSQTRVCTKTETIPHANVSSIEPSPSKEKNPEDSPTESGPLVMAFTVAFDSPSPNKKFNIRDSISKYAPRKAEVERIHRQKEKPLEPVTKKVTEPEIIKSPPPPPVELRKKKSTNEKKACNQSPGDSTQLEPKLSNGATYLIEKMFLGGDMVSPDRDLPSRKSDIFPISSDVSSWSPTRDEDPSPKNEDCKSDTGTYTIDEELNNKIVKEARQKIDEVFGVGIGSESGITEKSVTSDVEKLKATVKSSPSPNSDELIKDHKTGPLVMPPIRPKRRLPVPPVQPISSVASPTTDDKAYLSYDNYTRTNHPPDSLYSTFPKESKRNTIAAVKLAPANSISLTMPNNRLTTNNLDLFQNSCSNEKPFSVINGHSENSSPIRTSPVRTTNWRRSPWHLSGSDMELDQMRAETSSVLSDVSASTEPPSMNPSPGVPGPQMKFNRAFALRRARLGLETELPPASKSLVSRDSKPPAKDNNNTNLTPFSRQDGGRFSLRLPRSSPKSAPAKGANRAPAVKSPATLGQKFGHRRMESDPSKIDISKKNIPVQVPKTKTSTTSRPPFQRASSFANSINKGDISSSDLDLHRSSSRKQTDRLPISSVRSIPKIPQVVNKDGDYFTQENRSSPKPMDKHELSALDCLVIQATYQLSTKLKTAAHRLLAKERDKFTEDSSERLMINEVLPNMATDNESTCSTCSERGVSQELAGILKNLKRVEQSLKVLTIVVDEEHETNHKKIPCPHHANSEDNLYVVDI